MIVIVGAGLAGLACATRLEESGREWLLLESSSKPGGRVRTEITEGGYLLDAGFQVFLDSYPTASRLLDVQSLEPRYFESGALLVNERGESERLLNPIVHPEWAIGSLFSRALSWSEKLSLATHAGKQLLRPDKDLLKDETGRSTFDEIGRLGLDGAVLERFLRPFFAGVLLDNELGADASIFDYNLKKFALGRALLPAGGMGSIPKQLSSKLPDDRQRYGFPVKALRRSGDRFTAAELSDGSHVDCSHLVLATDETASRHLLGLPAGRKWLGASTFYFSGEEPLYEGALLVLPEGRHRLVRHFVDLTNITPEYAPAGKRLLSATVLNPPEEASIPLAEKVKAEISALFPAFTSWNFLQEVRISHALPSRHPGYKKELLPIHLASNLYLAGDQVSSVGIEAALLSGLNTAEEVLIRS